MGGTKSNRYLPAFLPTLRRALGRTRNGERRAKSIFLALVMFPGSSTQAVRGDATDQSSGEE